MGKRIVLCLDGTWNEEGQTDQGTEVETNVRRIYAGVDAGGTQRRCYFPGVGTRLFERVRGGLFGWGLFEQIKDAYRELRDAYEPGDDIFLFGFSRGAYSARSLAGMIQRCGILKRDVDAARIEVDLRALLGTLQRPRGLPDATDEVFALYKEGYDEARRPAIERFKRAWCHAADIRFLGVWDTVGALGLPDKLVLPPLRALDAELEQRRVGFLDTRLGPEVRAAAHALAIDERREPFLPALWTDAPGSEPRINVPGSGIEQVWFAGAHANVGGGYRDRGLSDIALAWMARAAGDAGLALTRDFHAGLAPDPLAARRDSLAEFLDPQNLQSLRGHLLGTLADRLSTTPAGIVRAQVEVARPIASGSVIHDTVVQRLAAAAAHEPAGHEPYAPPPTLALASQGRDIDRERYRLAATL